MISTQGTVTGESVCVTSTIYSDLSLSVIASNSNFVLFLKGLWFVSVTYHGLEPALVMMFQVWQRSDLDLSWTLTTRVQNLGNTVPF